MLTKNILSFKLENRQENIPQLLLESILSKGVTES